MEGTAWEKIKRARGEEGGSEGGREVGNQISRRQRLSGEPIIR